MGIETAIFASAVIGGISSAKASSDASKAQKGADASSRESLALQERQMNMTEDQYARTVEEYEKWKSIYGPLQEDLGTYYNNLTGTTLSNAEVARIQDASQKAMKKVSTSLAQSGRTDNAAREYILGTMEYQAEIDKANMRSTAEERAIGAKSNFLALGLNQANNLTARQAGLSNSMQANSNAQGTLLNNMAAGQKATSALQSGIWSSYTDNLQDLLGYGVRNDVFGTGKANTTGTTAYSNLELF